MKLLVGCGVILLSLCLSDLNGAPSKGATFGAPADSFLTGCELILFGDEVPLMTRNGRKGYWVVKTDSVVAVNGIVVVTLAPPPNRPSRPIPAEIARGSEIIEAAAEHVWQSRETHKGLVMVGGQTQRSGDEFSLSLPAYGTSVLVRLYDESMLIVYENRRTEFPIDRPVPRSQAEINENKLNGAYRSLVADLKPGGFVVRGLSYTYSFPLSRADEIRAALGEIPIRAEIQLVDPYDGPYYKAIRIADTIFASDAIRDFIQD